MLGFGTVGSGVYRMLADNREAIARKAGFPVEVVRVGVRDLAKPREAPAGLFTDDLGSVVDDTTLDVVLELMGGVEPAGPLVERALANGISVVTANKELMAKSGARLVGAAKVKGLDLHYEAAVGGGIPLVQPLKHQLAGNDVIRMMGILNGTTNYILTAMQERGAEFADVLAEAQALGYAEADPTADVDGWDTMYKISILASIAFGRQVDVEGVHREGIRRVAKADIAAALALGYRIKLLGVADACEGERVRVRVHPALVPLDHPLASVSGVYNALFLQGDFVGDLMFSGRGAGSDPTASAVVGDLIDVGRNLAAGGPGSALPYGEGMELEGMDSLRSAYYLRMRVEDRPRILGRVATLLGERDVSMEAMEMRALGSGEGEIVFLTHPCRESDMQAALRDLESDGGVGRVESHFRVV